MRAVLFDFYGTLAEGDGLTSWEAIAAEMGYELSPEAVAMFWAIDGHTHDEHSRSAEHYRAWQRARLREVVAASGVPAPDDDELVSRIGERFWSTPSMRAYPDSEPVLRELRARGVRLAICSNWDWHLHEAIEAAGLTGLVDVVISSAWVGARKPHPRIYERTLAQLDIAPEHAIFVGDTWRCDVEGPRAFGMQPVYLRRPHMGVDHTAPPDGWPSVPDLEVLLDLATG